ncbi:hypothetical protein COCON_G00199200 [Conger conger]|uniref:Uncharacterized protein n=1 Tax=Conger conger TaxID=82655 RepID=A0A9Q1D1F4_CONCO|nr:hypothetical protein COCON_G00199200 [Conger conger]
MSQRVRRNVSPTTNIPASSGGGGGNGGVGAPGANAGLSSFGRLVPMKATVPFQLKLQPQPPLQTRSPHGTRSGGTSPSASGCEATGARTSTSSSRSPTRAVSASASPLAPSSASPPFSSSQHASPAAAVGTQTASASSGGTPTITTHASASGTGSATGRPPSRHLPPPQQQLAVSSAHGTIHHNSGSVISSLSAPPCSVPGRSPCSSPTPPLLWLSDSSLQAPSPSSSSSSSSSSSGGPRDRPQPPPQRASPEPGRQSPRDGAGLAHLQSCSLDTLTGPYLSGHWPRDSSHAQCAPCMRDKATQTPSAWADECSEKRRSSHKRSASWGAPTSSKRSDPTPIRYPPMCPLSAQLPRSAPRAGLGHWYVLSPVLPSPVQLAGCILYAGAESTVLRSLLYSSIAKLRQQLQRSKHSSRHHRDKERKPPFNGNHAAISQSQAPIPKSVLIPIPISKPVSRFRNSVEGLNQEIERIIVRETGERDEQLLVSGAKMADTHTLSHPHTVGP